ncbi:uncharacterized protein TNCT_360841 [Trichonephila clavata]|uniref:Uncharacterized protein n=1 Tax=Trichonephila clavata TaxID=2740835 RepID=A0A8X6F8C0_TRICU|nr:uncharacterized protein TNCT_360841 [Trichonephila clavata]
MSFKNKRVARRHLSNVLINIQAVDKQIKPCYLWDLFTADISEIRAYLKKLHALGLTKSCLSAFSIDDTVFVTHYTYLKNYLNSFQVENVSVVDVSNSKSSPALIVSKDEKWRALAPVLETVEAFLKKFHEHIDVPFEVKSPLVNLTTLFGFLLSYPVLYWYTPQTPDIEFLCLSMIPLKVHQVTVDNNKNECELFSFSVPQKISDETELMIGDWFNQLAVKSRHSEFYPVDLICNTVMLPSVSM